MPSVPYLVAARRSAVGTAGHAFAALTTTELAAPPLAAVAAGRGPIDDVVLGNCLGPGGNVARLAALAAGIDPEVPAVTVDRQCGSGLDAILQGAARIRAGEAALVLAGGVESASTAPWRYWPPEPGQSRPPDGNRYRRAPFAPPGFPDPEMGLAADDLARRRGISRARQDEYAARSHQRAHSSLVAGVFADEIVPVAGVVADERPRPGMSAQRLSRLRPAFGVDGTVTAGNSCGISDGAAVVALADRPDPGSPAIELVGAAVHGGDPALPGACLAPSVRKLLRRQQIEIGGIGAVEITEAFAAVALAAIDDLGLDEERVCRDGGAIGLGHPWGASGALLVVRLMHRMSAPDGPEWGLAACAIGGGQGISVLLRRGD